MEANKTAVDEAKNALNEVITVLDEKLAEIPKEKEKPYVSMARQSISNANKYHTLCSILNRREKARSGDEEIKVTSLCDGPGFTIVMPKSHSADLDHLYNLIINYRHDENDEYKSCAAA